MSSKLVSSMDTVRLNRRQASSRIRFFKQAQTCPPAYPVSPHRGQVYRGSKSGVFPFGGQQSGQLRPAGQIFVFDPLHRRLHIAARPAPP